MFKNLANNLKGGLVIISAIVAIPFGIAPRAIASYTVAGEPTAANSKLTEAEISQQIKNLPGWTVKNQELTRTYEFKNFVESINFVNKLVEPAEKAGHHPDIEISYNKVTIRLTTHDRGGITQQDFELAKIISQLK